MQQINMCRKTRERIFEEGGVNQSCARSCPGAACSQSGWTGRGPSPWERGRLPPSGWSAASLQRRTHHLVSGGEQQERSERGRETQHRQDLFHSLSRFLSHDPPHPAPPYRSNHCLFMVGCEMSPVDIKAPDKEGDK